MVIYLNTWIVKEHFKDLKLPVTQGFVIFIIVLKICGQEVPEAQL